MTGAPPLLRQAGPAVWHLAPERPWTPDDGPRVLIGGVGYWWQRDASFGLAAVDVLAERSWPAGVRLAKLDYGALYVVQDIQDVVPPYDRIVLLSGTERGRDPGRLYCASWHSEQPDDEEIQARIREAGAGVIDVDHLLVVGKFFNALPDDVVLVEVEPVDTGGGEALSAPVAALLEEAVTAVAEAVAGAVPDRRVAE